MEYKIVNEYEQAVLEKKVNELIKQGWKPQGGICWSSGDSIMKYAQAMIKI